MPRPGFTYILASRPHGTLYTGVTANLVRRVWQHRTDLIEGFTKKYGVHLLVYYECYDDVREAILREKRIKRWERRWKVRLIEAGNPRWEDLYGAITGAGDDAVRHPRGSGDPCPRAPHRRGFPPARE